MKRPIIENWEGDNGHPRKDYTVTYDRYHTGVKCWVHDHFHTCTDEYDVAVQMANAIAEGAYAYGRVIEACGRNGPICPETIFNCSDARRKLDLFGLGQFYLEWLIEQEEADLLELPLRERTQKAHQAVGLPRDIWRNIRPVEIPVLRASEAHTTSE